MKNHLLLLFIFFTFTACKKDINIEKPKLPSKEEKKKDTLSVTDLSDYEKKVASFSMIYEYSEEGSKQVIGITKLKNNSIKYHLLTNTLPCDTEYWGIAIDNYADMDPETDEDENGMYPSREYVSEKSEYIVSIRIALDFSKVIIKYTEKEMEDNDCLPITDKLMKKIK